MSTSPEPTAERADDRLVNVLSRWLARHVGSTELLAPLNEVDPGELAPEQAEAVEELREGLTGGSAGGDLEMLVRETLEALALGG